MENNKLYRILSIIALVFVGIFSVALILFFIDPYMLDGIIAFICLVSGFVGLTLFIILKLLMREPTNGLAGYVDSNGDDGLDEDEESEGEDTADEHLAESESAAIDDDSENQKTE